MIIDATKKTPEQIVAQLKRIAKRNEKTTIKSGKVVSRC
tara:strand:- start:662 stop:778 length:117 start_codon:yes stop_codon:yes gene_type:complete